MLVSFERFAAHDVCLELLPTFRSRTFFNSLKKAAILSGGTPTVGKPCLLVGIRGLIGASTGVGARFKEARAEVINTEGLEISDKTGTRALTARMGGGGGGGGGCKIDELLSFLSSCQCAERHQLVSTSMTPTSFNFLISSSRCRIFSLSCNLSCSIFCKL